MKNSCEYNSALFAVKSWSIRLMEETSFSHFSVDKADSPAKYKRNSVHRVHGMNKYVGGSW